MFNEDLCQVIRPKKKLKTQLENTTSNSHALNASYNNGLRLLKVKRPWKPKFKPGQSATPSISPRLNIKRYGGDTVNHVSTHNIQSSNLQANVDLSPHEYSKTYILNEHHHRLIKSKQHLDKLLNTSNMSNETQ